MGSSKIRMYLPELMYMLVAQRRWSKCDRSDTPLQATLAFAMVHGNHTRALQYPSPKHTKISFPFSLNNLKT